MGFGLLALPIGLGILALLLDAVWASAGLSWQEWLWIAAFALVGPCVPMAFGCARLQRAFRSPRRVGAGNGEIHFGFPRKVVSVRLDSIRGLGSALSLLNGPVLEVDVEGYGSIQAVGVDARLIESVVSHVEARAGSPPLDPWALTGRKGDSLLRDARYSRGIGEPIAPPRGAWITPTRAFAAGAGVPATRLASFVALGVANLMAQYLLPSVATNEQLLVVIAAIFTAPFFPGVVAYLFYRRGGRESVMILREGGANLEQATAAVESALRRLGVAALEVRGRRAIGSRGTAWRMREGVRIRAAASLTATQTRVRLRTRNPALVETHQRLKGEILAALEGSPDRLGARAAPASAQDVAPDRKGESTWNRSILADGTVVADSAWVSDLYKGVEEAPGWMSRSRDTDRRIYAMTFPGLAALLVLVPVALASAVGAPLEVVVPWVAVLEALIIIPMAWYAYPIASGKGAVAAMSVPKGVAAEVAKGRIDVAINRLGQPVGVNKPGSLWHLWTLRSGVRLRFITSETADPHRLLISARKSAAQDSYLHLKGLLIEEFGFAKPASPPGERNEQKGEADVRG